MVENNITSFRYEIPFPNVGRYLNIALTKRGVSGSYVHPTKEWISPRTGLVFFVEAERAICRQTYCVKCSYDIAYQKLDEAIVAVEEEGEGKVTA